MARLKQGPGNVTRQFPRKRPCDLCDEYSKHMQHRDLVYQFFNDADGGYHRHIVYCPDIGLRAEGERVH
jgi:hypothetical protein